MFGLEYGLRLKIKLTLQPTEDFSYLLKLDLSRNRLHKIKAKKVKKMYRHLLLVQMLK